MDEFEVLFHPAFVPEFRAFEMEVKEALGEVFDMLRDVGSALGRPNVDTLKGSRHKNMKEVRVNAVGGAWRIAFGFDPQRRAIILCGGDKAGVSEDRFTVG